MSTRIPFVALTALFLAACPTPVDNTGPENDAGAPDPDEPVICEETSECPDRHICQGGVCVDVGADGCTSKAECTGDDVCVAGACGPAPESCTSSDECPGALVCDGFSQSCVDLNASGCQVESDCALEPGCANGCTCEADGSCEPIPVVGTDAGPDPVQDSGPPPVTGDGYDLSGFRIENREHDPPIQIGILPDNTVLQPGDVLVLARNATEADFQAFWGVSFAANVLYLNAELAGGGVPNVNGDETWALLSPLGTLVDATPVGAQKNRCWHRVQLGDGTDPANWAWDNMSNAHPGETNLPAGSVGIAIDQWSDASDYNYEFLQITYQP